MATAISAQKRQVFVQAGLPEGSDDSPNAAAAFLLRDDDLPVDALRESFLSVLTVLQQFLPEGLTGGAWYDIVLTG